MTREKLNSYLGKQVRIQFKDGNTVFKLSHVKSISEVEQAIKALEQEPCEDAPDINVGNMHENWTLCSKRMPKPNETRNMTRVYYLVQNKYGDMAVAYYDGRGWVQMYHGYLKDKVVAWMPLPEIVKLKGTEK